MFLILSHRFNMQCAVSAVKTVTICNVPDSKQASPSQTHAVQASPPEWQQPFPDRVQMGKTPRSIAPVSATKSSGVSGPSTRTPVLGSHDSGVHSKDIASVRKISSIVNHTRSRSSSRGSTAIGKSIFLVPAGQLRIKTEICNTDYRPCYATTTLERNFRIF